MFQIISWSWFCTLLQGPLHQDRRSHCVSNPKSSATSFEETREEEAPRSESVLRVFFGGMSWCKIPRKRWIDGYEGYDFPMQYVVCFPMCTPCRERIAWRGMRLDSRRPIIPTPSCWNIPPALLNTTRKLKTTTPKHQKKNRFEHSYNRIQTFCLNIHFLDGIRYGLCRYAAGSTWRKSPSGESCAAPSPARWGCCLTVRSWTTESVVDIRLI